MSCRHDLALGTCLACYPDTGTIRVNWHHEPNLDGPGARPVYNERAYWFKRGALYQRVKKLMYAEQDKKRRHRLYRVASILVNRIWS